MVLVPIPNLSSVEIKQSFVASEELETGQLVNVFEDSGIFKCRIADSVVGHEAHGFVKVTAGIGDTVTVYYIGKNTTIDSPEVGCTYYLGQNGSIISEAGDEEMTVIQSVGIGIQGAVLFIPNGQTIWRK